jgi:methylated-DNA-[protein]-cysteine S-methyltransferase
MEKNAQYYSELDSPIGSLLLVSDGATLTGLYMHEHRQMPELPPGSTRNESVFMSAKAQLLAYFAGELLDFDLAHSGLGTPFQRTVWRELCNIPYGATCSYGQLANAIGNAKASRAVGLANGRNPISIIVPCHRVIGANGTLTGYGGGLPRKQWLLEHERRQLVLRGRAAPPKCRSEALLLPGLAAASR